MNETISVSAPGKLMLSGEWSVLEKGCPCIVLAVSKRVIAKISEAPETRVHLKTMNLKSGAEIKDGKVVFENTDKRLDFTKQAIETALAYLKGAGIKTKNFELETETEMNAKGAEKVGFGSSAAAVVAITGAVLKLHNLGVSGKDEKERLFKLGIIAHYFAQGKIGSGFDVAASVFGGALYYKRFDDAWLEKELKVKSVYEVAEEDWPLLEHKKIKLPKDFRLVVGFTGKSASTKELVQKVHKFRERFGLEYTNIIKELKATTEGLLDAFENGTKKDVLSLIEKNRAVLRFLGQQSGVELETKELADIADVATSSGGAAKFSGAGGGDCAIGICFTLDSSLKIASGIKRKGYVVIEVNVSDEGVESDVL